MASEGAVDFLVLGASGYFGSNLVALLKAEKRSFATDSVRIVASEAVTAVLDRYRPKFVLCAAGISGRPNIDWCDSHATETIRTNVLGTLNVVDLCSQRQIHCTVFGTGYVYSFDRNHPVGGKVGFSELDPPNCAIPSVYIQLRILLEQLVQHYSNCLHLRIQLPISSDFHERSTLAKLVRFKKIYSVPISFTILDDMFPLIFRMAERGIVGNYNFVNPGLSAGSTEAAPLLLLPFFPASRLLLCFFASSFLPFFLSAILPFCHSSLFASSSSPPSPSPCLTIPECNLPAIGVISHADILELYREHVDSSFSWNLADDEEVQKHLQVGRPGARLDASKLEALFPGELRDVRLALEDVLRRLRKP
eukprot:CAMPEP_0174232124 /NCGR_PEP_ID=MMETSP0417-20130205/2501_1 /TAXON_ID=242541 /ORGANISM="Mayorella sp, Strain BSH-02190019" /LENGTH=363 /DNA_ID=CAMNT_0015310119 /DNA_START=37 /DNA_END=1127 /DNA_ORIENTATION=+